MSIEVKITGSKGELALNRDIQRLLERFNLFGTKGLHRIFVETAQEVRSDAIEGMQKSPATGKLYHRGGIAGRRSSPGNPPRPDTGNMIASIVVDIARDSIEVGSTLRDPDYPAILEMGSKNMKARPWLRPALEKNKPELRSRLRDAIRKAAGGGI